MDNLPISVVIVARNAESTIEECLSSVQRNSPAEIIVVDGNSTDSTVDIAKRYTERIYFDEGRGLGYARQLGAEQATQEYIAYVDSDVILLTEGALAMMLAAFQSSDYVSISAREAADMKCSSYWEWGQYQHYYYSRLRPRQDYLTTMAGLIRKDTVLRYRFDVSEKYLDDFDLGMRLGREGYKFGTSSALFYHHYRPELRGFASYRFFLGRVAARYIRKYGPWHVSLWPPISSLYWLGFFLIKGNFKIMPYLVVDSVVLNGGLVKGFFDLIWNDRGRKMRKVNLGCGWDGLEGWINIDKSPRSLLARYRWSRYLLKKSLRVLLKLGFISKDSITGIRPVPGFKLCDISKGLPFNNNEVACIYASHILEHLTPKKASFVLKECHRVLVPGGILRILVPDLRVLVTNYLEAKQAGDPESADKFMESMLLHGVGEPPPLINRILGRWTTGHRWVYDFESLAHKLYEVGFIETTQCESGKGAMEDIHLFTGESTHYDSLYLEAKGAEAGALSKGA